MKRLVVIGSGIVGLSCAWRLIKAGATVTIVDPSPAGDKCSFGNAGGIAVTEIMPASVPGLLWHVPRWLMDPLGPLAIRWRYAPQLIPWMWAFLQAGTAERVAGAAGALAALNALVYEDLVPMLSELGLLADLQRAGAIVLYSSAAALERERAQWQLRSQHGIDWRVLSRQELTELEPDLAPHFQTAVFMPTWSHVASPRRIVDRLRERLLDLGSSLEHGRICDFVTDGNQVSAAVTEQGHSLPADAFIVAAGAWSATLARRRGDRILLESERGYNTTVPAPGVRVRHELIFAEHQFVVTPLEAGLRVGGAAEFAGLDAPPDFRRARALLALAQRALPQLTSEGGVAWMGNRPATPDSLPVIGRSRRAANVYYAFGHCHLGLTQSAPTARLIAELIEGREAPFSPQRFIRAGHDANARRAHSGEDLSSTHHQGTST